MQKLQPHFLVLTLIAASFNASAAELKPVPVPPGAKALREDPGETKDLAAAHPEKVAELRHRYDVYLKAAVKPLQLQTSDKSRLGIPPQ